MLPPIFMRSVRPELLHTARRVFSQQTRPEKSVTLELSIRKSLHTAEGVMTLDLAFEVEVGRSIRWS
jgi:hypothetical protein